MTLAAFRRAALVLLAASSTFPAHAQIVTATPSIPDAKIVSPGGVDMRTGEYVAESTDLSIGPKDGGGLSFVRIPQKFKVFTSNWHYKVWKKPDPNSGGTASYFQVENGAVAQTFWGSNNATTFTEVGLISDGISGLQLLGSGSSKYFVLTRPDGTTIRFRPSVDGVNTWAEEIRRPDGIVYSLGYDAGGTSLHRVSSNAGYQLILEYNATGISKVCAINAAFTTPPASDACPVGARSVSYTYSGIRVTSITDAPGAVTTITSNYVNTTTPFQETFYKPGIAEAWLTNSYTTDTFSGYTLFVGQQSFAGGRNISYDFTYLGRGELPNGVVFAGQSWTENSLNTTNVRWGTYQANTIYTPAITAGPNHVTDPLGRTTDTTYDGTFTKIQSVRQPSGLTKAYTYNANRSVTQIQQTHATGYSDPAITVGYTYDCTYAVNCKKPATVTDARGNTTNYTYDPTHGGVLTETLPAPTVGAVRPQKRYTWNQYYAWYRNTAGTLVQASTPVWLVTSISECRTLASCAGTSDETRTTFTYGASGTPNNLLPTQKTVSAGDGSIIATATFSYDADGDKVSEDGALPGSADTAVWKYDIMRRVTGLIGPDPDGGGPLKFRATRNTYDAAGRLIRVERGTTLGQSDADWAAFVALESVETDYDPLDRKIKETKKSGGTAYTVTQYSYDTFGRLECTAMRMNAAAFGSLPTSACSLGTEGSYGPDRITRNYYDAAGQLTSTQLAVGTADAASESKTYTADGLLATQTDGENNRTTLEYDGHDRMVKTRYPVPTQGALTSSTTDYEQLGYDANGNVTSRRRRDGQWIYSTVDALNRTITKDLPSPEIDVTYSYDLQGRLLSATQGSLVTGQGWDALGRMRSETNAGYTSSLDYDEIGRLTRITHSDGFYVTYVYNTVDLTSIREYGTTSLVSYGYDDLGRRTSLSRANGATTGYSYDAISRLSGFSQDVSGTAYDLSVTPISYNPASQIISLTRSNDAYAWGGHYNVNRSYAVNGLNQVTTAGSASVGYDLRGNLTQNGTNTYSYTVENRLISGPGGVLVAYDPIGRLAQVTQGASSTRFEHLGSRLIIERDGSGAILRRYVHGPGDDEPVVWYEGSGTANRRYLQTDERGSVVAVTDGAGALLGANSYDEYGVPGSANLGRFQYTGQAWIAELGLSYYKARMYDPRLGRFMQTDPIGYGNDLNLYAYVDNDPIDKADPTGMWENPTQICVMGLFCTGRGTPQLGDESKGYRSLGGGYTSRKDNVPGTDLYEVHVYKDSVEFEKELEKKLPNLRPHEVGIVGPDGQWLKKHGHEVAPKLPGTVNNAIRGIVVDSARQRSWLPDKGTFVIRGKNLVEKIQEGMGRTGSLKWLGRLGGTLGVVGEVESMFSIDRACSMDPGFEGC